MKKMEKFMQKQTDHIGNTNKMVTAVEWLDEQLQDKMFIEYGYSNGIRKIVIPIEAYMELKQEAKQMEKEQIIEAYDAGLFDGTMDDVNDRMYKQYYNETYNK